MLVMFIWMTSLLISVGIVIPEHWAILWQLDAGMVRITNGSHLVAPVEFECLPDMQIDAPGASQPAPDQQGFWTSHGERNSVFLNEMVEVFQASVMNADVMIEGVPAMPATAQLVWLSAKVRSPSTNRTHLQFH